MDEPLILDDLTTYTYPQILDLIETHGSVILTIQFNDIERLKTALAVRKSRRAKAFKDKEIPIEDSKLSYQTVSAADKDGWIKLRIDMKSAQGIRVKGISIPGEF